MFKTSSQELVDEKDNYVRRMNEAFEAAMEFEKQRLQKTRSAKSKYQKI